MFLKLKPSKIKQDFENQHLAPLVEQGHIFMLLSPNLPNTSLQERENPSQRFFKDNAEKIIESTGSGWLSELFILTYRLERPETKPQQEQKRKAETQDEIDTAKRKKPKLAK